MSYEKRFIKSATVHGKGKIQVPSIIRKRLKIEDEDQIMFYQDSEGKFFIEISHKPKKPLGTY